MGQAGLKEKKMVRSGRVLGGGKGQMTHVSIACRPASHTRGKVPGPAASCGHYTTFGGCVRVGVALVSTQSPASCLLCGASTGSGAAQGLLKGRRSVIRLRLVSHVCCIGIGCGQRLAKRHDPMVIGCPAAPVS